MSTGTKVLAALCIVIGLCVGASFSHTKTVYRDVPGPTKTVTETKTVTKQAPLPAVCLDAFNQAGALVTIAGGVSTSSSKALDFLNQIRTVIITMNTQGANDIENNVRDFDRTQIAASQKLADGVAKFNVTSAACQDAIS